MQKIFQFETLYPVNMQIRELLEKLLDDDEDMRDMNLSAR